MKHLAVAEGTDGFLISLAYLAYKLWRDLNLGGIAARLFGLLVDDSDRISNLVRWQKR